MGFTGSPWIPEPCCLPLQLANCFLLLQLFHCFSHAVSILLCYICFIHACCIPSCNRSINASCTVCNRFALLYRSGIICNCRILFFCACIAGIVCILRSHSIVYFWFWTSAPSASALISVSTISGISSLYSRQSVFELLPALLAERILPERTVQLIVKFS